MKKLTLLLSTLIVLTNCSKPEKVEQALNQNTEKNDTQTVIASEPKVQVIQSTLGKSTLFSSDYFQPNPETCGGTSKNLQGKRESFFQERYSKEYEKALGAKLEYEVVEVGFGSDSLGVVLEQSPHFPMFHESNIYYYFQKGSQGMYWSESPLKIKGNFTRYFDNWGGDENALSTSLTFETYTNDTVEAVVASPYKISFPKPQTLVPDSTDTTENMITTYYKELVVEEALGVLDVEPNVTTELLVYGVAPNDTSKNLLLKEGVADRGHPTGLQSLFELGKLPTIHDTLYVKTVYAITGYSRILMHFYQDTVMLDTLEESSNWYYCD